MILTNQIQLLKRAISANRNFLLLWSAQICTQSAVSIFSILVGILSHEGVLSGSTEESSMGIGVIINLATFPGLVIAPIAGVLADWFSKKSIMITSNIIRFLLLVGFIFLGGWRNLWFSYALILVLSVVLQFFIPAEGGLIPIVVDKSYLLLANSLFSLTVYSTLAVGILLSGILLNVLGIGPTFVFCGFLFVLSTFFLYKVRVVEAERKRPSFLYLFDFVSKLIRDVKTGLVYSFSIAKLRFALMHLFLLQIGGLTLVTIIFKIGEEIYGVSPRTAGVVVLAPTVVGLISGLALLNMIGKRRSRVKLVWIGTLLSAVGFGFMAIIAQMNGLLTEYLLDKVIASASLMAIGLSVPFLLVPAQTLLYENTKADFRGRVLGIWLALTSSLASVVAVFMGFLTDRVGHISITITIVVILDLIYSAILYLLFRKRVI